MAKTPCIYQKKGMGWFFELSGKIEGPLNTRDEAQKYLNLMLLTCAARNDIDCLNQECLA